MRSRTYLQINCLFIAIGAVTVAAVPHMVPIMRGHGLSDSASAGIAAIVGIAVILGRGLVGLALDHLEAGKVLTGILGLLALAMALLAAADQIGVLMVAVFLTGFAVGAEVDILAFLVSRYFPQHLFSRLYGTALGVFMASSGVGPLLLGTSFAKTGDYRQGLVIMSVVALIASGLSSRLPSSRRAICA
jgi:sugar phosphate permease